MALNSFSSDDSSSRGKLRLHIFVIVVFLFSAWKTLGEFNYLLFGKTAEPLSIEVYERQREDTGEVVGLKIEYTFNDPKLGSRDESDNISVAFAEENLTEDFKIEFIPGSANKSRIEGNRSYVMMGVFFCLLLVLIGFGIWLWRTAHDAVRKGPHERRTPR